MLCDMSSDITERSLKESKIYLIIALIQVVLSKLRLLAADYLEYPAKCYISDYYTTLPII